MNQWWNRQGGPHGHPSPFVSWSSMPGSQPFRVPPPAPPHAMPYPPYPFSPGMYFQQQNNYINANYPPPNYSYPFPHGHPPFIAPKLRAEAPKRLPATINLDEDQVIVISDSEEREETVPKEEEQANRVKEEKVKTDKREKGQKLLTEPRRRVEKDLFEIPVNLQPRRCKAEEVRRAREDRSQERRPKVARRKSDRFVYRLKPHQKKLMELSRCREFMPGELMTGPQFQARVHSFRHGMDRCRWLKLRHERLMQRLQR